jgi:hypothetical protein
MIISLSSRDVKIHDAYCYGLLFLQYPYANAAICHDIAQTVTFADLLTQQPGFDPWSGRVKFVMDKAALGQVSSEYFGFACQFSSHQVLHIHHHPTFDTVSMLRKPLT